MRETTLQDIARLAEPVAPPAAPREPAIRPRSLRARFQVRNRRGGESSMLGIAHCDSLLEARQLAHQRALSLSLPVVEVAPWESFESVAKKDAIYLVFLVIDEFSGETVKDSALGKAMWDGKSIGR